MGSLEAPTATLAYWLPCGSANFLRATADQRIMASLESDYAAGGPRLDERWWQSLGASPATPSSSLVTRTAWAVSQQGWDARGRLESTRNDPAPERLAIRATVSDGAELTLTVDADGLHRWQLAGGDAATLAGIVRGLLGRPDQPSDGPPVDWHGIASDGHSGDVYVDDAEPGYLPFFQLNLLFGGLFNPAFVPAVFLESDTDALGELAPPALDTLIERLAVRGFDSGAKDADVLGQALRRFLAITFEDSLGPLKWRLERVRRAFLGSMLGLIHRKAALTQLREDLGEVESFDNANEAQQRGYVMLVSAKLALLQNVLGHIEATTAQDLGYLADDAKERAKAWRAMLKAIEDNLAGLENAVQHAWMDRMLYEQEQARAEQEALGEIERIRLGEGKGVVGNAEALFAGVALIPSIAGLAAGSAGVDSIALVLGIAGTVLLFAGLLAAHAWRSWRKGDARLFYELNLRLDAHVPQAKAGELLRLTNGPPLVSGPIVVSRMRRGAMRIERVSDEDAIHKIHFDGKVTLPQTGWMPPRKVPIHVICELLHHRPSANFEYILRELRVICPDGTSLEPEVLLAITKAIAKLLVDPFVSDGSLSERIENEEEPSTIIFQHPAAC